jgi:hypothetical protein
MQPTQAPRPEPSHANYRQGQQSFHRPHSSLGATGHWLSMLTMLAPLIIPEFIENPSRQWRWVRISSIATAMMTEGLYTARIHKERERDREECQAR